MTQKNLLRLFALLLFAALPYQHAFSQCFQIESILVDACGGQEGLNEMVRFKAGNTPLNANTMIVSWPNNTWQGIVQNATTASKTAALNADIAAAGGCAQLIEPPGGIIPANATAILVTSYDFDTTLNPFGAITQNIYIIYQDATTTSGHFANFGSGLRTLTIIADACSDTVTYDRGLLEDENGVHVAANGATVLFDPANNPDYINNGCLAPVPPFSVDAGTSVSGCAGTTVSLGGSAEGQQSILWTAASGSFSDAADLSTTYTIPVNATGTLTLTLTATNSCGATVTDTVTITITNAVVPDFPTALTICSGSVAPVLAMTSPDGITGIWTPSAISNTASGNYVFTPNPNQCASSVTLTVTVTNSATPNFPTALTVCNGATPPVLSSTSPNGITGTWNPATIDNSADATYVFTPDMNQCVSNLTLAVTVTNSTVPDFATTMTICGGSVPPVLNTISPNGISGSWNPSIISNTTGGSYIFTPDTGQCAVPATLSVTVSSFAFDIEQYCSGSVYVAAAVPVSGSFNPDTANYVWTDNGGSAIGNDDLLNISDWANSHPLAGFPQVFTVTVTTENGCTATQNVTVSDFFCSIPKGISPNNDGLNDSFDLSGMGIRTLSIFNRYGVKVFTASNYTNQWHGQTDGGNSLPDGTYYYVIENTAGNSLTGWVYINSNFN